MPVNDAEFKLALSHFASGVTVVTTEWNGKKYGMTVASFASLSLHPPLVLICIDRTVQTHDAIAAAGTFGVSILAKGQADLSNRFASRSDDKFSGVAIETGVLGVPLIGGALARIECTLADRLPGGDHTIFVGLVESIATAEGEPLIYYRGGYREIAL